MLKNPYGMNNSELIMAFENLIVGDEHNKLTDEEERQLSTVREVVDMRLREGTEHLDFGDDDNE